MHATATGQVSRIRPSPITGMSRGTSARHKRYVPFSQNARNVSSAQVKRSTGKKICWRRVALAIRKRRVYVHAKPPLAAAMMNTDQVITLALIVSTFARLARSRTKTAEVRANKRIFTFDWDPRLLLPRFEIESRIVLVAAGAVIPAQRHPNVQTWDRQ